MFPVCALQQLEGGRALRSIRFSTYRYGVRRQGTVHIERDDDLQCTKGYTPPPPGPQKGEGETASRSRVVCVCAGHHHGMCRGSLGRGHLRRRRVDGRFSHESRPAGFCRSRVGLGLFFVDCPFFFSRPAVGGMNRWRRGGRERGDSSFTIVALSLLLVVRFKVRPLASALQWRGSREGPGGGYVPYPMLPFSISPFLHFSIFSSPSSSIHALLGKQPPPPSIVCGLVVGLPVWLDHDYSVCISTHDGIFRCSRLFPLLGNLES